MKCVPECQRALIYQGENHSFVLPILVLHDASCAINEFPWELYMLLRDLAVLSRTSCTLPFCQPKIKLSPKMEEILLIYATSLLLTAAFTIL